MKPARTLQRLSALWLAFQVAGCGRSPTESRPLDTGAPSIASVDSLTPGGLARVRGKNLEKLTRLTVDGREVSFEHLPSGEVQFTVPALRECDTEGRNVAVVANGAVQGQAPVRLPSPLRLRVGESRELSASELGCVQLPAGGEDYLLAVLSVEPAARLEPVFRLSTYPASGQIPSAPQASVQASLAPGASSSVAGNAPASIVASRAPSRPLSAASPAGLFDPRLATAQAGDTVRLVDWDVPGISRNADPATMPTFAAVVVAVAGNQVILVDSRLPNAGAYLSGSAREKMQRTAEIADLYALPALRTVLGGEFSPLQGAGGRVFTLVRNLPTAFAAPWGNDQMPKTDVPLSSEVFLIALHSNAGTGEMSAGLVAASILHEMAHVADDVPFRWGISGSSVGWYSEAMAVSVEEAAARMAQGREIAASPRVMEEEQERKPYAGWFREWPVPSSEKLSPLAPFGRDPLSEYVPTLASYHLGSRLLLFARERLGEAKLAPAASTLHQRLAARAKNRPFSELGRIWGVESIAAEVGTTAAQFLEEFMVAEITNGLIPASARGQIPQFLSWEHARDPRTMEDWKEVAGGKSARWQDHLLLRSEARTIDASVPTASHHHWFIPAEEGKGLTLQATNLQLKPHHRVKLIRLR